VENIPKLLTGLYATSSFWIPYVARGWAISYSLLDKWLCYQIKDDELLHK
jgi:hypothetical protein